MSDQNLETKVSAGAAQADEQQRTAKLLDETNARPASAAAAHTDNAQNLFMNGGLQGNYSDLAMAIQKNPYLLDDPYVRMAYMARMGVKPTDKTDIQAT